MIHYNKMATTIQVSDKIKHTLDKMKLFDRETYNEIIERMIEDEMEVNEQTKKDIEEARKRIKEGKFFTQKQVEEELGLR